MCANDRLGNELYPVRGAPNLGPGCYDNAEVTTFCFLVAYYLHTFYLFLLFIAYACGLINAFCLSNFANK